MVFTLIEADSLIRNIGNIMCTVRKTLAGAAFLGSVASGLAFADGGASTITDASTSATSAAVTGQVKPAAAHASKSVKKPVKAVASKNAPNVKAAPGPGRMQVEEPKSSAPMGSAKESKAWQKNHARGLTEDQKKAFRERKEKMEAMITVIKEKRKAMRDAKPEERAALARELHSLILEKDPAAGTGTTGVTAAARVAPEKPAVAAPQVPTPQIQSQQEAVKKNDASEVRRQRLEIYQLQQQKKEELRRQQMEKFKSGMESGPNSGTNLSSQGNDED